MVYFFSRYSCRECFSLLPWYFRFNTSWQVNRKIKLLVELCVSYNHKVTNWDFLLRIFRLIFFFIIYTRADFAHLQMLCCEKDSLSWATSQPSPWPFSGTAMRTLLGLGVELLGFRLLQSLLRSFGLVMRFRSCLRRRSILSDVFFSMRERGYA